MPDDRIPRQKLGPIIDEIEQLEREGELLERAEVQQVLQQVAVPTNRLDEAVARVEARELESAKKAESRRKVVRIAAIGVGLTVLATSAIGYTMYERSAALARVTASDAQLSVAGAPKPNTVPIKITGAQDIQLDVVLHEAPSGRSLDMTCDWVGPSGQTLFESRYQTKTIDRGNWPTHCKYSFKSTAPTGAWTVRMKVEDRVVIETPFTIE
ncbi:MAG: hypothetical protein U0165_17155 [Polyangiaceae bacterium]